jgi:hypothetical protein
MFQADGAALAAFGGRHLKDVTPMEALRMPSLAYAEHEKKKAWFFLSYNFNDYVISLAAHPCAEEPLRICAEVPYRGALADENAVSSE